MTLVMIDGMMVILLLFGLRSVMKMHEEMKEYKTLKNDLSSILRHLQTNMNTAESTISTMQESIKFASTHVTPYLPQANVLRDDLNFLLDHGEKIADRLENLTREAKRSYFTPQTVVFDPDAKDNAQDKESVEERNIPKNQDSFSKVNLKTQTEHDVDKKVERKGFFTTIRRVR